MPLARALRPVFGRSQRSFARHGSTKMSAQAPDLPRHDCQRPRRTFWWFVPSAREPDQGTAFAGPAQPGRPNGRRRSRSSITSRHMAVLHGGRPRQRGYLRCVFVRHLRGRADQRLSACGTPTGNRVLIWRSSGGQYPRPRPWRRRREVSGRSTRRARRIPVSSERPPPRVIASTRWPSGGGQACKPCQGRGVFAAPLVLSEPGHTPPAAWAWMRARFAVSLLIAEM